jgi:hypothetical protein
LPLRVDVGERPCRYEVSIRATEEGRAGVLEQLALTGVAEQAAVVMAAAQQAYGGAPDPATTSMADGPTRRGSDREFRGSGRGVRATRRRVSLVPGAVGTMVR